MFSTHDLIRDTKHALATNDAVLMLDAVERAQYNWLHQPNNAVAKHVRQCARMLFNMRYGTPKQPRLANALKANTPIRLRHQTWR